MDTHNRIALKPAGMLLLYGDPKTCNEAVSSLSISLLNAVPVKSVTKSAKLSLYRLAMPHTALAVPHLPALSIGPEIA